MADMVGHEIVEHIAVIGDKEKSVKKELNLVSWNNKDAKYDLRPWSADHERAYKGLTLTHQEAKDLYHALAKIFKGRVDD